MSVTLQIAVPGDAMMISRSTDQTLYFQFDLDNCLPMGDDRILVITAQIPDGSFSLFEKALCDDPAIIEYRELDRFDNCRRYQLEWSAEETELYDHFATTGAAILSICATPKVWTLKIQFLNAENIASFQKLCCESNIPIDIVSIFNHRIPQERGYCLTTAQREALVTAYEAGLYDIPRKVTTHQLAEGLGISDQAFSERLRRAHKHLLEGTVFHDE